MTFIVLFYYVVHSAFKPLVNGHVDVITMTARDARPPTGILHALRGLLLHVWLTICFAFRYIYERSGLKRARRSLIRKWISYDPRDFRPPSLGAMKALLALYQAVADPVCAPLNICNIKLLI